MRQADGDMKRKYDVRGDINSSDIVSACRIRVLQPHRLDSEGKSTTVVLDDVELVTVFGNVVDSNDDLFVTVRLLDSDGDSAGHDGPLSLSSSRRLPPASVWGQATCNSLISHETRSQPPKKPNTISKLISLFYYLSSKTSIISSTISILSLPIKISSRAYICLSMIHFRTRSFSLNSSTKADIYHI